MMRLANPLAETLNDRGIFEQNALERELADVRKQIAAVRTVVFGGGSYPRLARVPDVRDLAARERELMERLDMLDPTTA